MNSETHLYFRLKYTGTWDLGSFAVGLIPWQMSSQATKCKETVRVPPPHCKQKGESGSSDRSFFLDSKITTDCDCSLEIKKCLPLGRKAMTNLDSILKSTEITLQKRPIKPKLWCFEYSCMDIRAGP